MISKTALFITFFSTAFLFLGCGAPEEYPGVYPEEYFPPVTRTVTWYAPSALDYVVDRIAAGCKYWGAEGVACEHVEDRKAAEIRFLENRSDVCVKRDDLARAFNSGNVVLCTERMLREGKFDGLETIVAHEVGHMLGVAHVQPKCDGTEKVHPSGASICGRAVMNPVIPDPGRTYGLQWMDLLAYDVRGHAWSDVPEAGACIIAASK